MSYGTRGPRRKASGHEDPNVIPRTAPLGFLGKLPFKIGGTLRYKPSAANLQDHPGVPAHEHDGEQEPLLGGSDREAHHRSSSPSRPRSNTTGSGDTSSSYRSRGDLFPSDGEGDDDAVPLDDEFAMALDRVDDRGSTKTRSSKGKYPAGNSDMSRSVSQATIDLSYSHDSVDGMNGDTTPSSFPAYQDPLIPSLEDLRREEEQAEREEAEEIERRRRTAVRLASERGLSKDDTDVAEAGSPTKGDGSLPETEIPNASPAESEGLGGEEQEAAAPTKEAKPPPVPEAEAADRQFIPARLPRFG